jgi:hypothetical protein
MFYDELGYCETALPPTAVTALATRDDWIEPPRVIPSARCTKHQVRPTAFPLCLPNPARWVSTWWQRAPPADVAHTVFLSGRAPRAPFSLNG